MRITALVPLLDGVVFARPYRRLATALAAFAALVLPSSCVACGLWDTSLCPACHRAFRTATARAYRAEAGAESLPDVDLPLPLASSGDHRVTSRTATPRGHTPGPGPPDVGPLPVLAAGRYGRAVSAVLLAFKNHGHVDLLEPVAAAMGGALHAAATEFRTDRPTPAGPVLLVPVPTRASSRRRRGYDPLMLVLSRLDRGGALPAGTVLAPAVRHVPVHARLAGALARGGVPGLVRTALAVVLSGGRGGQKSLGRRHRRTNVMDSMGAVGHMRGALAGTDCIVVDDVLTTGATIGEVHRVLAAEGARVLGAVVVAATSSPAGSGVGGGVAGGVGGGVGRVPGAPSNARPPGTAVPHGRPGTPPQVPERRRVNKGQA